MISGQQLYLNQRELDALSIVILLAVAPHFFNLDIWIALFFLTTVLLRLLLNRRDNPFTSRWLLFPLLLLGLINLLIQYPIPLFRSAAVALLVTMLGLKLLEVRQRRDLYVVVFLGYFTLITQFLYRQEIWLALYALLVVTAITAILVETSRHAPSRSLLLPMRKSITLLFQALPLMLVLFLLFPRLSGPLWDLGLGDKSGVTGLSDKIHPGSISELSQSREVAFRVHFKDAIPPPQKRYWRGPVFWNTDGVAWNLEEKLPYRQLQLRVGAEQIDYTVILEPTRQRWLFALELPFTLPPQTHLTPDFQLLRNEPVERRISYEISSHPNYNTGDIHPIERQWGLALPDNITPRMRALVAKWRSPGDDDRVVVDRALAYFRHQPFYYTLHPPLLEENPADQFLFDSRRGFCEHYATSFTLLMRVAGIPARVVTGYQGGEINPMGDYLIVRQSDAHAWSEVWLQGQGWVRIDPTAAVAPERIEQSFNFDLADDEIGAPVDFTLQDQGLLSDLARRLRWGLDALNTGWHRWVLGYSRDRQSNLLEKLGLGFLQGRNLAIGMVFIAALTLMIIALYLWRSGLQKPDPVKAAYLLFCRKLAKTGVQRRPTEGPRDFAARAIDSRPDLRNPIEQITRLYIAQRYGRINQQTQRRELRRLVRAFRP